MSGDSRAPLRLLVVMPSWVGDVVMATPTLRLLRERFKGAFIGGLVRPGIDQLLAGSDFVDELHVERASGVMGPKFVAAKVRPRRYDTAILLTNSFSTALVLRLAGIPRRIGYDRDARGLLLTDKLSAPKGADGSWRPVPAVDYYLALAQRFLLGEDARAGPMELATTPQEEIAADALLARASVEPGEPMVILNPGGNNAAKRWPADRFAAIADVLAERHGLRVLLNGSPAETGLVEDIAAACRVAKPVQLSAIGINLGSLKAVVRRCSLMVTNDTGPRHIAAAFGVPLVSLFGPTDHRWTLIPTRGSPEVILTADPTLPETEAANDHPERCRIERIGLERVVEGVRVALGG